jgi:hypothetical protein
MESEGAKLPRSRAEWRIHLLSESFRRIRSSASEKVNYARTLTNHFVSLDQSGRSGCSRGLLVPRHKRALTTLSRGGIVFDFQITSVHQIHDHALIKQAPSSFIGRFALSQELPHRWHARFECATFCLNFQALYSGNCRPLINIFLSIACSAWKNESCPTET